MQVFVKDVPQQLEIDIPMSTLNKLDSNKIGSVGIMHLSKAEWRNIIEIWLCLKFINKHRIQLALMGPKRLFE